MFELLERITPRAMFAINQTAARSRIIYGIDGSRGYRDVRPV